MYLVINTRSPLTLEDGEFIQQWNTFMGGRINLIQTMFQDMNFFYGFTYK